MPCLGFFKLEFQKTIVIFEINIFKLVKIQSFVPNKKKLNGRTMPYLRITGL